MNYLAHAYLSFGDPEILVGNMISDFVKGKKKFEYPPRILRGIDLHRAIDDFTDRHREVRTAKSFFKEAYGLYSAPLTDIVFDHFVARMLSTQEPSLHSLTIQVFASLDRYTQMFPRPFAALYPYMKSENWLLNYQYEWGIRNSLRGLVHRARYINDAAPAFSIFLNRYHELQEHFTRFFPSLYSFADEFYRAAK